MELRYYLYMHKWIDGSFTVGHHATKLQFRLGAAYEWQDVPTVSADAAPGASPDKCKTEGK